MLSARRPATGAFPAGSGFGAAAARRLPRRLPSAPRVSWFVVVRVSVPFLPDRLARLQPSSARACLHTHMCVGKALVLNNQGLTSQSELPFWAGRRKKTSNGRAGYCTANYTAGRAITERSLSYLFRIPVGLHCLRSSFLLKTE
jgi:hypothetical protein